MKTRTTVREFKDCTVKCMNKELVLTIKIGGKDTDIKFNLMQKDTKTVSRILEYEIMKQKTREEKDELIEKINRVCDEINEKYKNTLSVIEINKKIKSKVIGIMNKMITKETGLRPSTTRKAMNLVLKEHLEIKKEHKKYIYPMVFNFAYGRKNINIINSIKYKNVEDQVEQAIKNELQNIIPFIVKYQMSVEKVKSELGNEIFEEISKNKYTRNMLICRMIDEIEIPISSKGEKFNIEGIKELIKFKTSILKGVNIKETYNLSIKNKIKYMKILEKEMIKRKTLSKINKMKEIRINIITGIEQEQRTGKSNIKESDTYEEVCNKFDHEELLEYINDMIII